MASPRPTLCEHLKIGEMPDTKATKLPQEHIGTCTSNNNTKARTQEFPISRVMQNPETASYIPEMTEAEIQGARCDISSKRKSSKQN